VLLILRVEALWVLHQQLTQAIASQVHQAQPTHLTSLCKTLTAVLLVQLQQLQLWLRLMFILSLAPLVLLPIS
jgi:hypothetical protein